MAYTLHAKLEWEGTDIDQSPFEPSWEVADADLINSGNWAQLAKEKRAALGLRTWSIGSLSRTFHTTNTQSSADWPCDYQHSTKVTDVAFILLSP
jgi:hypothetical protein